MLNNFSKEEKTLAQVSAVYPFKSELKENLNVGSVKQISQDKVVINLGSLNNILVGDALLIDNKITVIARDVFPELTIAEFENEADWQKVENGMKAVKLLSIKEEKKEQDPLGD